MCIVPKIILVLVLSLNFPFSKKPMGGISDEVGQKVQLKSLGKNPPPPKRIKAKAKAEQKDVILSYAIIIGNVSEKRWCSQEHQTTSSIIIHNT